MSERELYDLLINWGGTITIAIVILTIIKVVSYVLTSLSYKKIFEAYGYKNSVYAFIPFYNLYILADLTCGPEFKLGDITIPKKYFVWWWLVNYILKFIPIVGTFISFIAIVICKGYCHDTGIKKIDSDYDEKVLSYLSSIISLVLWILVLPRKKID